MSPRQHYAQMSETPNKKSLNNGVRKAGTEGEGFSPGRCPVGKYRSKKSKEDKKMAILCNLQAKEETDIGYRKRTRQYWKNYALFELQEQHLPYQVKIFLKTGKLSKIEVKGLKRQIKQLHVDSVECETGELDRADEKVVTQSDDNVLLQEFTAGASGYVEGTGVIESESKSDTTK